MRLRLITLVGVLGACGGAATSSVPGVPGTALPPEARLQVLQRDFDDIEAELAVRLAGGASAKEGEAKQEQPNVAPPEAPKALENLQSAEESTEGDRRAASSSGPSASCALNCRALSSMRRSADGICALTNEQHERCTNARSRVETSTRRVAAAGCLCPQ